MTQMKVIAHIHNSFKEKFGIPRQSGLVEDTQSVIVFEKQYRDENALRGIEEFSHLWLIWNFSKNNKETWSPTVRPPRLGGNKRMGVFATRSPFRPNPIGLSCVELVKVEKTKEYGVVLRVSGADLLDGTPIYDIKPYLCFTDSKPYAKCGFASQTKDYCLEVDFPKNLLQKIDTDKREILVRLLSQDPRPAYHNSNDRVYAMSFDKYEIKFVVCGQKKLKVTEINETFSEKEDAE